MRLNFIFLLILYLLTNIKCENKEEEIKKEEENAIDQLNEEEGRIMSDEVFEAKLQKVLEERHLTKKKKITKEVLQQIFEAIYNKEFDLPDLPDLPQDDNDPIDINPKFESKQFLEDIFNKLAKSLDYDDEIKVSDIKEWISPIKVKEALNEIIEGLISMLDKNGEL